MRIRPARVEDAPAMGQVMVESWLSGHRGQMPDAAWEKRRDEWTPAVSGRAWERSLRERDAADAGGDARGDVVMLAVDEEDAVAGLVLGSAADDDASGRIAEIAAIYVATNRRGQGVGRLLLRAAAAELAARGFATVHIAVLAANPGARAFYEAMGGRHIGEREFDEEGLMLAERVYEWADIRELSAGPT